MGSGDSPVSQSGPLPIVRVSAVASRPWASERERGWWKWVPRLRVGAHLLPVALANQLAPSQHGWYLISQAHHDSDGTFRPGQQHIIASTPGVPTPVAGGNDCSLSPSSWSEPFIHSIKPQKKCGTHFHNIFSMYMQLRILYETQLHHQSQSLGRNKFPTLCDVAQTQYFFFSHHREWRWSADLVGVFGKCYPST
jgi:hypothetical protein